MTHRDAQEDDEQEFVREKLPNTFLLAPLPAHVVRHYDGGPGDGVAVMFREWEESKGSN